MKLAPFVMSIAGLCWASGAVALNVSPHGTGQVLLYPYYTVNRNQDTYFSVANFGRFPQVVKIRFLEGRAGRPDLDVDVVLNPRDTWTAAISVDAEGGAKLVSSDSSCTRPAIPNGGLAFTASGYDGSGSIPADDGPHGIERTREGFAEVIGGALIAEPAPNQGEPFPIDCETIFGKLSTSAVHLAAPDRLYGWAAIIDVANGHYYSYNATAIDGFTASSLYSADWGPLKPSLDDANGAEDDSSSPVAHFFLEGETIPHFGVPQRGQYERGVDAVTAVLMADTIENDYVVDPALGANTDWVITMPTRRFYVDPIYPATNDPAAESYLSCCAAFAYDRSGQPELATEQDLPLGNDVNVISFLSQPAPQSGVFGSELTVNAVPPAATGSMRLDMPMHAGSGINLQGLPFDGGLLIGAPVIGFMAYDIVNANAQPGRLANYGAVSEHRRTSCGTGTSIDRVACEW
jgi:hypothetical protein